MIKDAKAEMVVLGGAIKDENLLHDVLGELNDNHFTTTESLETFKHLTKLSEKGRVTLRILSDSVDNPKVKQYVETAYKTVEGEEHFEHNFHKVIDLNHKRRIDAAINEAKDKLQTDEEAQQIAETIFENVSEVNLTSSEKTILNPIDQAHKGLERFFERLANPETSYGLRFSFTKKNGNIEGLPSIDRCIRGARNGDLILIAAETGVGKTALGINIARTFSIINGHNGYYANSEMDEDEITARLVAPLAGCNVKEIMYGELEGTQEQINQKIDLISNAHQRYADSKLHTSRIPSLSVQKIRAIAKQMELRKNKPEYMVVDYIQRMEDTKQVYESEQKKLIKIAMRLKELAVEMDIPIIVLAQRNFEGYVEGAKAIRNECDAVFYLEMVGDDDTEEINNLYLPGKRERINYKIIKNKVRRDDDLRPIYVSFDKKKQYISEVGR